jgi:hypothetical protein
VRARLGIGALLAALLLSAAPAAADSVRLETVTEDGVTGSRVVYIGDERDNEVWIVPVRHVDSLGPERPHGFLVTGASSGPGCEAPDWPDEQVCRVPHGTRLLAPRVYARGGSDLITISVPRRGAVVYGGPGNDHFDGPYGADGETLVPSEIHGGPGDDSFEAAGLLYGGPGDDDLRLIGAPSRISAGPGNDQIIGTDGADVIDAGRGNDEVFGGAGNDVIRATDRETDELVCDDGRDKLTADGRDESLFGWADPGPFDDCERLQRRGEPLLTPFEFQGWEGSESYVSVLYGCPPDGPGLCIGTGVLRRGGRVIARSPFRDRAGNWGVVVFRLGARRISRLVGKDIRITLRWHDRAGQLRSLTKVSAIPGPSEGDDN